MDDPGTLFRELALTASTGRPPRCVTKSSCRCSRQPLERTSCSSLSVTRWRPLRSSARSLRSRGDIVAHVRAVLFDSAADRLAERLQPEVDRGRELRQERRLHRAAHAQRAFDRVRHLPERTRRENAAARRRRGRLADVVDSAQLGLERLVEERDRLGSRACRCATSAGSGEGASTLASSAPRSVVAAAATRSRIGGSSSSSSAKASITTSVGPSRRC